MKPPLMLNMIVRNESARIVRCLNSVLPYVKSVAILDTGSTDGTVELIQSTLDEYALRTGEHIHSIFEHGDFKDFSQARNQAFALAKFGRPNSRCQFALLVDADMELVVDQSQDAFGALDARAMSYDMMQTGGSVSYANRRIINLDAKSDPYVGVTHEYLDLPSAGMISGARFVDHADGFNRKDKYARDAALLNDALKTDPDNGRYLYYLGNTYRDGGNPLLAIDAYQRRIALGGWDEETHSAMMNLACAYKDAGDEPRFIAGMLDAYSFRPSRAEPLYDLAKHCREKGQNYASLCFAKQGMTIPRPNDLLFLNDFVYSHGLRYEYSISGFYDPAQRESAFTVTDDLALDPTCPEGFRSSARTNLFWHLKPLKDHCPSFVGKKLSFKPPEGYTAMNPSVAMHGDQLLCNIRCVNYKIDNEGRYMIGPLECGDAPIDTRNFVVVLDDDLYPDWSAEIIWNRPAPAWDMVTGLEDIRLSSNAGLRFTATAREQNAGGMPQMIAGTLDYSPSDMNIMDVFSWSPISDARACEKNWMPVLGATGWLYNCETYLSSDLTQTINPAKIHTADLRGSSQAIPWKRGYLAVVHEAGVDPSNGKRTYWHRFAWFDRGFALQRLSKPFVFYDRQIEFCAGIVARDTQGDFVISFGVRDAEAHVATVDQTEISRMLALYWT